MIYAAWLRCCFPAQGVELMTPLYVFQCQKLTGGVKLRNMWDGMRSRWHGEDVDWRRRKGSDFETRGKKKE